MANIRVLELAKEFGIDVLELQRIAVRCGLAVSGPTSMLDDEDKQQIIEAMKSNSDKNLSARTSGKTLTLNRPIIAGQIRRRGRDDRGRVVTVEVRRRRSKVSGTAEIKEKQAKTSRMGRDSKESPTVQEGSKPGKESVNATASTPEAAKQMKNLTKPKGRHDTSRGPRTTFRKGPSPAQIASSKAPRSTVKQLETQIKTEAAQKRQRRTAAVPTRAVPRRTPSVAVAPMPSTRPPAGQQQRRRGIAKPQRRMSPAEKAARRQYAAMRHGAPMTEEQEERMARFAGKRKKKQVLAGDADFVVRMVEIPEAISVSELASRMAVRGSAVVKRLFEMGTVVTLNEVIDAETAQLIVEEFGHKSKLLDESSVENILVDKIEDEEDSNLLPRPPVVVIMGHVDHGKTSILDAIRKSTVTKGEAGGITQHIGAYMAKLEEGSRVVFLDTPGHEAFTSLRARGARITDVAVLVVAADDGVKPQTVEAINHAKAAGIPIIVAMNKIDKAEADPDRVKRELAEHELVPEDWGGDTVIVPVSAITGEGLDSLLEMLSLQTELLELKANPELRGRGVIIEARLERGRGPIATVLVQSGTFRQGDLVVTGTVMGRVRALVDENGTQHKTAGPSIPAEILGLNSIPEAGQSIVVVENERQARDIISYRQEKARQTGLEEQAKSRMSLDDLFARIQEGVEELPVLIKGDVSGSVDAMVESLNKAGTDAVRVKTIHKGIGGITENDVMLASASNAIVIGFNVRPDAKAKRAALREGVDVRFYRVIYDAIDDVRQALTGLLAPTKVEKVIGAAEVREVFSVPKLGAIGGSYVTDGFVTRHAKVRVLRDSVLVYEGVLASLKRFKDDVKEVKAGYECGIGIDKFNDIKVGDIFEFYLIEEVATSL